MNKDISNNNYYKNVIFIILIMTLIVIFIIVFYLFKFYKIYLSEEEEKEEINKLKTSMQDYYDHVETDKINNNSDYNSDNYNTKIYNFQNKNIYNSSSNNTEEEFDNNTNNSYKDCIIEIPDINLSKIVYTGNERAERLSDYELVTASSDMKYINGGNYIICGHASRLYGHSLNRLKEVHKGTLIRIWAKYGLDEYEVKKVYYEDMDKTSDYCRQTTANELTIVSCAKNISVNSYIIVKAIKK